MEYALDCVIKYIIKRKNASYVGVLFFEYAVFNFTIVIAIMNSDKS